MAKILVLMPASKTVTSSLRALGFTRGEIQSLRNWARSKRTDQGRAVDVPRLVRYCCQEMAYQVDHLPDDFGRNDQPHTEAQKGR